MQAVVFNIVVLSLLVFLFGAVSWVRQDDRLRCWAVGWLCVLAHCASELWRPATAMLRSMQESVSMDMLALAGICFIISTVILTMGRNTGVRLGVILAVSTLLCINLAIFGLPVAWPLAILIAGRLAWVVLLAARHREMRTRFRLILIVARLIAGAILLYGALRIHPQLVIGAILAEIYLAAAVDFVANDWERTVALNTMILGLVAWAAVFPVMFLLDHFWPHFYFNPVFLNLPKFCVAVGMILVVLEDDMRAARALSNEYRLLFDANPLPLWIQEKATGRFLSVNQAALEKHGYTRDEFLQLQLSDIVDPEVMETAWEMRSSSITTNRALRHIRKDGTMLPMDITAYDINFRGKQCRFVHAVDVKEREELQQRLLHQSLHDPLTGLPNRILFQERLTEAVSHAIRAKEKLAVLCMDLHRFKRINDTYGVTVGDACLQYVAGILGARVRLMDTVARTGGEEFAVVLTGIKGAATAEQAASELRETLTEPTLIQGYKIQLPLSMGLAVCPDDGIDPLALWRGAESALRQAQAAGGGQTVWLSPELSHDADEHVELESYIQSQLEEGGFHLAYQPIYGIDGSVCGLEALLRLNHPRHGALSPAKFIPIAEETGLIIPLGQWVIEEVCRQLKEWSELGARPVPVAVNVSGLQLMHAEFAGRLTATLERHDIDPHWIHMEVTETAAMHNVASVLEKMAILAERGFKFSIDDFGTGHSSLGRLHQLPISILKIDRSFIDRLCERNGTYSIVQAIISMAHALGHKVVAEGVETEEQLARLRSLKCDQLQGYLLSRPAPSSRIPVLTRVTHPMFPQGGNRDFSNPSLAFGPA